MRHSRREFIMKATAAAVTAAGAPAAAQGKAGYDSVVLAEPSLLVYWRLDGDLSPAKGGPSGDARGGDSLFRDGPIGRKALVVQGGRFVSLPSGSQLDTDEATVELFFALLDSPRPPYNPCIVAKRSSSPNTRFSIHYEADLHAIDVWNGQAVAQAAPPEGPLKPGEWHHLAITSRLNELKVYVDGIECSLSGPAPFNLAQKGLPLQIGASSPQGEEAATCAVADVAIYGAALPAERILKHLEAAGWLARRKRILTEQQRREAERQRARKEKIAKRMHDPRLFAPGKQKIHRGEELTGISFGIGGIGAGCIQMNGRAERHIWQIFNNFEGGPLPNSYFAVRARTPSGEPVVRALQTSKVGPFAAMESLTFRGEYPFAWYDFEDSALPIRVSLEAYSPFIPLNARDSAIPCAVFNLTAENSTKEEVEVTFLAVQQNAIGWDGHSPILDKRYAGYGGNRNRVLTESGITILHMAADKEPSAAAVGDMALLAKAEGASAAAGVESLRELVVSTPGPDALTPRPPLPRTGEGEPALPGGSVTPPPFLGEGPGMGAGPTNPTPPGQTVDGALEVPLRLKPGEKRTVPFVLVWHFPSAHHGGDIAGWEHAGNRYAKWWPNALEVARYVATNLDRLDKETRLYHDTFYKSNLPWWLKDRITSQTAVLRSKTCFWSGDGYFGAWEGCAPGSGCCAGCCTHVWHYAQAYARLFPEIARKMRQETYGYQKPDGSLPHRHPSLPPAFDGQCGDILGAYREHLCSTDGKWLADTWPRVKRAMEHTIGHWDSDEDGVLAGAQWNTLDGELGGSTSWMGTLYLAALEASARMADIQGDRAAAVRYRRIRESGARKQNETLWNGEYYIQIRDPEPRQDYGDGCEIDQVLGEWWGRQVGIPNAYPVDRVRSALQSLLRYNFQPDFHGLVQAPRKFVEDSDPGLQMIKWPKGNRPTPTILYGDEVMTGFEYSAAGAMIQHGLLREGFLVALAISDRYDGRLRTGLTPGGSASWGYSGNPFGDDECGKYYARAMSVWSLLLAAQGFHYDGPAGIIGFAPVWRPDNHVSFFTGAEGWGLFTQKRSGGKQKGKIEVAWGRLRVRQLVFAVPGSPVVAGVTIGGRAEEFTQEFADGRITIRLTHEANVEAGQAIEVQIA